MIPLRAPDTLPPSPRLVAEKAKILAEIYRTKDNGRTGQSKFCSNSLAFATLNEEHCGKKNRERKANMSARCTVPRLELVMTSLSIVHMLHMRTSSSKKRKNSNVGDVVVVLEIEFSCAQEQHGRTVVLLPKAENW